jgi:hypothetical protein
MTCKVHLRFVTLDKRNSGRTHNNPRGVNTTIELKNATSDNAGTILSRNIPRQMPVLSDEPVTFFSSIVVLTANGQLTGCATTAIIVCDVFHKNTYR